MKENEYITACNRVKVSAALVILRDTLPGYDGVITDEKWTEVVRVLSKWENDLFLATKIENAG